MMMMMFWTIVLWCSESGSLQTFWRFSAANVGFFFLNFFGTRGLYFDSRQTGRRGKERGRHSAKVAGSGTRTRDGRFEDYSLYVWSHTNPYTTSAATSAANVLAEPV
ncbi:hypothetical protein ATANTOWER_028911 [Ataeniobius toweri]|uniref:Secreted protein n=1 Tax=Ataeniobius toweri TaxID=208326 RepID=A0ABU7CAH1_9TELE|nr:hypothetical protein [Ataeniobius toweri]